MKDFLRAKPTNIVTNYLTSQQSQTWLNQHFDLSKKKSCKFLKDNDNLLMNADKGSTTVLVDKDRYVSKAKDMLSDSNTYKTINRNPTQTVQHRTKTLIDMWLQKCSTINC